MLVGMLKKKKQFMVLIKLFVTYFLLQLRVAFWLSSFLLDNLS